MTPRVQLIYDADCPNVPRAREAILEGFRQAGLPPSWIEWNRDSAESPAYVKGYGSPTILVDGRDVAGAAPGTGEASCRLYRDRSGAFAGAPSAERIRDAVLAGRHLPVGGWRSSLATAPGIAFAFLPKLACPACWPAYAGLLGSLGLGFLLDTAYLVPVTAVFLIAAVSPLAFRARRRRGYGPFGAGSIAAIVVLAGKFALDSDAAMYGGIGMLIAASVWNAWPRRREDVGFCPECVQPASKLETKNGR